MATILIEGAPRSVTLRRASRPSGPDAVAAAPAVATARARTTASWDGRTPRPRHCDDCIHDPALPICLRAWILVHRLPAGDGDLLRRAGFDPPLYADHRGRRVRVTMASRYGDLGISVDLAREVGYDERGVAVSDLANFGVLP